MSLNYVCVLLGVGGREGVLNPQSLQKIRIDVDEKAAVNRYKIVFSTMLKII
jgi:hypothetical protein